MKTFWYQVTLFIEPPLLSNRSGALPFGLDAAMFTDPWGQPALPGSLVKGNLRENWAAMGFSSTDYWLGKEDKTGSNRGKIIFSPWWRLQGEAFHHNRNRVRHSNETHAAADQMLQVARVLDSRDGADLQFQGLLAFLEKPAPLILEAVTKGLRMTPALGSGKGIGMGKLNKVDIQETTPPGSLACNHSTLNAGFRQQVKNARGLGIALQPLWPFCFPVDRAESSNALVSSETIPGAAVKAVLARLLNISSCKQLFDAMRISNALPARNNSLCRPLAPSFSLAIAHDHLYDLAACVDPGLIAGQAPAFQPDWKEKQNQQVRTKLGWPDIPRVLNLHNAHDSDKRAAKNSQLFSMESILPDEGLHWLCNINFPEHAGEKEIDALLDGLDAIVQEQNFMPLGKTSTPASLRLHPRPFDYSQPQIPIEDQGQVFLYLQSPARLLNSSELNGIPSTGGAALLREKYAQAWEKLSGGSLKLSHYYARQILKGGDFWWNKYHKSLPYQAQVFTDTGSLFVLEFVKGKEKEASQYLREWQQLGLPQLDGYCREYDKNPWIRENGWGEISLNIGIHQHWAPGEDWEPIATEGGVHHG